MPGKPVFVFVPGAWHSPSTWDKVVSALEPLQYKSVPVALPSTLSNPNATFLEDLEAVRNAIITETTRGNNVVVVVHSYGGMVGSSAMKGLGRPATSNSSPTNDASGHVIGLVMMASGFIPTGFSFIEASGGKPPPFWRADSDSGFAVLTADTRDLFYHDLPVEEGNYWVEKLQPHSLKSLMEGGEHAYAAWRDVPIWYLATTDDHALPIEVQRAFVQMAKDEGADVTLREVESSHSPMLSRPKEAVDVLLEAVKYFEQ